jgi:diguanylate cyclase (GGDEF)-like protein
LLTISACFTAPLNLGASVDVEGNDLSAFLSDQLDFIFFFYGMAFILLAATCWAAARGQDDSHAWAVLGAFAFTHGIGEWLDLTALIVGDTPAFAILRTALATLSFMLLMDFARLEAIRLGLKLPGRWIYLLLALSIALFGLAQGVAAAGILTRYTIGLIGAVGASLVLAWQAKLYPRGAKGFALCASAGFALYAVAAGIIVPAGPFWPSTIINQVTFRALTGMPIQLARGFLACWISLSIWAVWGERHASEVASPRYTTYVRQQFMWTLLAMGTILVSGWMLTEHLGVIYRENVQKEARTDIDLLASRLAGDTATIEAMVKALAGSPSVMPLLAGGSRQENAVGLSVLNLDTEASGAKRGYILDRSGTVVASSNRGEAVPGASADESASSPVKLMTAAPDYRFAVDPRNGAVDYSASHPIRAVDGSVIGVAALIKSLGGFEADLRQFDRPYFLVNPDGVVVMTNRPATLNRALWPLAPGLATGSEHPMMQHAIVDATWTNVDGELNYVRRRFANHTDWSLVILNPSREIFASRFLGIVITLLVAIMALLYLLGRGRRIHDDLQLDRRLKLQELARDLGIQATTDPLTGLHNRLKLGPSLVGEIQRAERYNTPLSLMLFDIDYFKKINDTYGHVVGDQVLVQLSRFVPTLIRGTDLLARWGGEEFLILLPGSDGPMAFQVAEKLREALGNLAFDEVGSITCSFGVTQYAAGETAAQFIARADGALYRAKSGGRNRTKLAPQPAHGTRGLASVA